MLHRQKNASSKSHSDRASHHFAEQLIHFARANMNPRGLTKDDGSRAVQGEMPGVRDVVSTTFNVYGMMSPQCESA